MTPLIRGSNHGSTTSGMGGRIAMIPHSAAVSCKMILIVLMMLSSLLDTSYAWRCSRCARSQDASGPGDPYDGNESNTCQECLDNGEEECLDYLLEYEGYTDFLPYHEYCEWKDDNNKELEGEDQQSFRDCSDWKEYGEDIGVNFLDQMNSQDEGATFYNPFTELKCYECDNPCTRLYTCGDTSYACNHLFDMTIIQFNADEGSTCRSILPLDPEHGFEYCGEQDVQEFTIDCGGLCDLDKDDDLTGFICPNGQPIDSFYTICSDQNEGGFARPLGFNSEEDITGILTKAEMAIGGGIEFEDFWHYSCVDFGDVTCALGGTDPPSSKKGKSKSKKDGEPKKGKSKKSNKKAKGTTKKSSKGEAKKAGVKEPKMDVGKRILRNIRGK